jgi:hypothetical protein
MSILSNNKELQLVQSPPKDRVYTRIHSHNLSDMIDTLKSIIGKFPFGFVFTTSDFPLAIDSPKQVNRILNNLVAEGFIHKLSKGRFYKPEIGKFGELPPDTYQVVKDLIEKDGKKIGYLIGYSAFIDFGLTTQVPATLQIGKRKEKMLSLAEFIVSDSLSKRIQFLRKIFHYCDYLTVYASLRKYRIQCLILLVVVY